MKIPAFPTSTPRHTCRSKTKRAYRSILAQELPVPNAWNKQWPVKIWCLIVQHEQNLNTKIGLRTTTLPYHHHKTTNLLTISRDGRGLRLVIKSKYFLEEKIIPQQSNPTDPGLIKSQFKLNTLAYKKACGSAWGKVNTKIGLHTTTPAHQYKPFDQIETQGWMYLATSIVKG